MNKSGIIILVALVCVIVFCAIIFLGSKKDAGDIAATIADINKSDWKSGARNGEVVMVAYGDYFCPASRKFHDAVEILKKRYPDELTFVFRHFPLTSIHPKAEEVAICAEAAGLQGKFWEMHNGLMAVADFEKDTLLRLANDVGLDMDQFRHDIDEEKGSVAVRNVKNDIRKGKHEEVNYTPYITINGEVWDVNTHGFHPDKISVKIDKMLNR